MPNDINNLDPEDIALKMIMGEHFHDETTEKPKAAKITPKAEPKAKAENPAKAVKAPVIEPMTEPKPVKKAQWFPVKSEPDFYDRLKACAKSALLFGGLSLLFFYWQQTGQMEASAAMPSICACTCLAGLGVGRNIPRD